MATQILLADDHSIVRQGLRLLLQREGFEVVGEAVNGQEAVRLATATCPDVAVLDYGMPLLNGVGAAREIIQACPRAKVILLTMHADDRYVRRHSRSHQAEPGPVGGVGRPLAAQRGRAGRLHRSAAGVSTHEEKHDDGA